MALSLSLVGTGSGAMAQNEGISISDPEETVPGQVQPARPVGSTSNVLSIAERQSPDEPGRGGHYGPRLQPGHRKASGGSTNL